MVARLQARDRVLRALRSYFHGQGFVEVETPTRVLNPGQEVHLDAIPAGDGRWLITSPEHHMKRLMGEGAEAIFQIARCFRAGEYGPHHQPEFTMLEWYRPQPELALIAGDSERLLQVAREAVEQGTPALATPFARTTVRALLHEHAGVALRGNESLEALRAKAVGAGVRVAASAAWDDIFFQLWLDRVETGLLAGPPTFVFDWPLRLGALARRKTEDRDLVERFELYAGGLELCNAFGELIDPGEQRARFVVEAGLRRARGKPVYPIDEALLVALARMPPTCGAAMGLDRLLMFATGSTDIRQVIAFPEEGA
jgi:lysyl-tRNA synthetase class 2